MITRIEIRPRDESLSPFFYEVSAENIVKADDDSPLSTYQLTLEQPLEMGITYEWRVYQRLGSADEPVSRFVRFRLPEAEERDRLTDAVEQLEATLAEQNITGEAAAIERVNFFAQEQLWTEVWRVLLSVPEPSAELEGAISETIANLCVPPMAD